MTATLAVIIPCHNLARLLLQGLHHGMAPERLRRVAATA